MLALRVQGSFLPCFGHLMIVNTITAFLSQLNFHTIWIEHPMKHLRVTHPSSSSLLCWPWAHLTRTINVTKISPNHLHSWHFIHWSDQTSHHIYFHLEWTKLFHPWINSHMHESHQICCSNIKLIYMIICQGRPGSQRRGKSAAPGMATPLSRKLGPGVLRLQLKFGAPNMGMLPFPLTSSATKISTLFHSKCSGMKGCLLVGIVVKLTRF